MVDLTEEVASIVRLAISEYIDYQEEGETVEVAVQNAAKAIQSYYDEYNQ